MGVEESSRYPCPCCGYLTARECGGYEICSICGWEDDVSQLRFASMGGGANKPSLVEAQRNYDLTGASDPEAERLGRIRVRRPGPDDRRDNGWRPITGEEVELGEPGVDQGRNYPDSCDQLYYWRPSFWRRAAATGVDRTVISFSFRVADGRVDREDTAALNEEFPEDTVVVDVDRQMVHVDRACDKAAGELTDIGERLQRALPGRRLVRSDIRAFAGGGKLAQS